MTHSLSLCGTGSQGRLTLRDHVGLCDHVEEEGQDLNHLLVLLSVGQLAGTEGLRNVCLEEVRVKRVHNLKKGKQRMSQTLLTVMRCQLMTALCKLTLKRYCRFIGFSCS